MCSLQKVSQILSVYTRLLRVEYLFNWNEKRDIELRTLEIRITKD